MLNSQIIERSMAHVPNTTFIETVGSIYQAHAYSDQLGNYSMYSWSKSDILAVRETLESRGVLGQLKARIRAEVFSALDDQREERPPLSHENLLMNELIREYLEFNKYKYTVSVLTAESGQPEVPLDRRFLASELKVTEDPSSKSVPLLYGLVSHFLNSSDNGGKVFLKSAIASNTTPGPDA